VNNSRRRRLRAINAQLEAIAERLEAIHIEEEEAFQARPDYLQSDKAIEEVEGVEQAHDLLTEVIDHINTIAAQP
jgi:hypothetical protein